MYRSLKLVVFTSLLTLVRAAIGPSAELVISSKNIDPDGFERPTTLAGGVFPGPVISGFKGSRFRINVVNKLSNPDLLRSTSIHWHGIHQTKGSNWADGAAFVTQCPIIPDDSFQYDFTVQGQAGTYWYHSHLSTQYCDGLRGPFIVYDPLDPHRLLYDVDNESTIITLSDWFHATYKGGVPPVPDSVLINGKGRYVNGPATPLAVVNVVRGLRYRFRIISMSCEPSFNFTIDNHLMRVIEADGENTALSDPVDNIQIHAGQRYSVIVKADQPIGNYWIRSNPDERGTPGFDNNRNLAIFRYLFAPRIDPTTTSTAKKPLAETDLRPLFNPKAPQNANGGVDHALNLVTGVDFTTLQFTMNGVAFTPPSAPVLLQILNGTQNAQDLLPKGSVYPLPRNSVIEISLPGTNAQIGGPHPFHLHGHSFSVVRSAGSASYNYDNPVRRDTVNTGNEKDNVTIRFVTDNTGPWFLHCHMDFHLELGLAVVFAEDIPGVPAQIKPPSAWKELCPKYNKLTGGPSGN